MGVVFSLCKNVKKRKILSDTAPAALPFPRSADFLCKSLDKIKKSAIIKVRGNTGDGYSLRLIKITAMHWECQGGYFFLFCISITNFTTASTKVPSRRSSSKVMYIGHHLPPKNRRKKKKFLRPPKSGGCNRHRQAVPAPDKICRMQTLSALRLSQQSNICSVAWCFQVRRFPCGSFIIHHRRRFVKVIFCPFAPVL